MTTVKHHTCIIAMICISCPAMGDSFDNVVHGEILHINNDTNILSTASIKSDVVHIDNSLYLYNQGKIYNTVHICDACNVYIQNSGEIYGAIHVPPTANLTRVIKSSDDAMYLNINGEYKVLVYKAKQLDWNAVQKYSNNVTDITLVNSEIFLMPGIMELSLGSPARIELIGENNFWINQNHISPDVPVLSNITGDGTVNFHIENLNTLYAVTSYVNDGNLYAKIVRETDYFKIMGSDTGEFLNSLRTLNPNDKLLMKLDAAPDMGRVNYLLHKSMRINTKALLRPIQTFNRHIDNASIVSNVAESISLMPLGIAGENIASYGLRAGINMAITDTVKVSLSASAANMNFSDGIDDYKANLIGGDIVGQYNTDDIFAYSLVSVTGAKFITPAILNDGNVKYNPTAWVANANINAGPRFAIGNRVSVIPMLGLAGSYGNLLTEHDTHAAIRAGMIADYSHQTGDILYKYNANISTDSNGYYQGGIQIGITSPDDDATGRVGVGFVNDEMGISYSAIASIAFDF